MTGDDLRNCVSLPRNDTLAIAAELDAIDAWRVALCDGRFARRGCEWAHDERCPVAIARTALFAATDARRAQIIRSGQ
jgi:hypothetical protein